MLAEYHPKIMSQSNNVIRFDSTKLLSLMLKVKSRKIVAKIQI